LDKIRVLQRFYHYFIFCEKKQLQLILNLSQPYAAGEMIYYHLSGSKEASVRYSDQSQSRMEYAAISAKQIRYNQICD